MPCNSDYMDANQREINASQVTCLLEEIKTGIRVNTAHPNWRGYHPACYNKQVNLDKLVHELCSELQKRDVTRYSLEMQIWWRDHQKADQERIQKEINEIHIRTERQQALAKLTPYERKLLHLD